MVTMFHPWIRWQNLAGMESRNIKVDVTHISSNDIVQLTKNDNFNHLINYLIGSFRPVQGLPNRRLKSKS